jgi:hypothetical protein
MAASSIRAMAPASRPVGSLRVTLPTGREGIGDASNHELGGAVEDVP